MPTLIGRALSPLSTAQLVRDYLAGRDPSSRLGGPLGDGTWPEDTTAERAARPTQGDYIARMHRRLKELIRIVDPAYQWPRGHSFKALIRNAVKLGLLEPTGRREEGKLEAALGFVARDYVRIVPGQEDAPGWQNFRSALVSVYPNLSKPRPQVREPAWKRFKRRRKGRRVSEEVAVPEEGAAPKVEARKKAEPVEVPAPLETERKQLLTMATFAASNAEGPAFFAELLARLQAWAKGAERFITKDQAKALKDGIGTLTTCLAALRQAQTVPARRAGATTACRAAARLTADALDVELKPYTPRQAGERAPRAVTPAAEKVPEGPSREAMDTERLRLRDRARALNVSGGGPDDFEGFRNEVSRFEEQARKLVKRADAIEMESYFRDMDRCIKAVRGIARAGVQRDAAVRACRDTVKLMAAVLSRPFTEARGKAGEAARAEAVGTPRQAAAALRRLPAVDVKQAARTLRALEDAGYDTAGAEDTLQTIRELAGEARTGEWEALLEEISELEKEEEE